MKSIHQKNEAENFGSELRLPNANADGNFGTRTIDKSAERAGDLWAEHYASAEELGRLEDLFDQCQPFGWERCFDERDDGAYSSAELLFFVLNPDDDGDRFAAAEFWEHWIDGEGYPDGTWVRLFAEGALGIA